jgi:hypothetical protein
MRIIAFLSCLLIAVSNVLAQFPERQLAIKVIQKPRKHVYKEGEPILMDVEIKNGLKHEVRLTAFAFSPNEWNGETGHIDLVDVYRLPRIFQICCSRPNLGQSAPSGITGKEHPVSSKIAGAGWYPIPAGTSKISTIDLSKWEVDGGWVAGKYQILVRVKKIDLDKYSWVAVQSDPITIEIQR